MRALLLTYLISHLFLVTDALASDVMVLQSLRVKPFDEALRGFRNVCKAGSKTVVVAEIDGKDMGAMVHEERPELILAIGADALQKVKRIRNIPIIYLMVLNPEKITGEAKNIVGINMNIPPQKYLNLMEKLNPHRLKVGVLYDPEKTGALVKRILQTADGMGVKISAMEVHSPKDVPETFTRMKNNFNIFWMLPDSTVITPETVKFLLLRTQENGIPVITFAGKYMENGALVSLDIDDFDLGKQAGEMANKILGGAYVQELPDADARKSVIRVNSKVAKELGINLNTIEASEYSN